MKKIIVLGSGMVGGAIAADLCGKFDVTAADINRERLKILSESHHLKTIMADLSSGDEIKRIVKDFDIVVGAVPGFMGFETVKSVIEAGKNIVDISFFEEDPFLLDEPAKQNNVTAIVDCGVAPGMSSIILGYHNSKMKIESFECYVGGLPANPEWPYKYKAPFSPVDVIEEYTRPARIVENGKVVVKPALSEEEFIDFDKSGKIESFKTVCLRTLIKTMSIPFMKEKTLRYPGHIEYIKVLRDTGFFGTEKIEVDGVKIRPVDLASKLLFPLWNLEKGEKEYTVMRIIIKGEETGGKKEYTYNLFDTYDEKKQTTSMARTTGYTCTAAVRMVLNGEYTAKGISPPEFIGAHEGCYEKVLAHLKKRGVNYLLSNK